MMLLRGVVTAWSRPFFSVRVLTRIKAAPKKSVSHLSSQRSYQGIIRTSSITNKSDIQSRSTIHEAATEWPPKQVSCGQLTFKNINDHVELHGKIISFKKQLFLVDKFGKIKLTTNNNNEEQISVIQTLRPNSYVKLTGVVKEMQENRRRSRRAFLTVLIDQITPVELFPVQSDEKSKNHLRFELHPEELSRCFPSCMPFFFQRSHNCATVAKESEGSNVTLCGWVYKKYLDNSFTLEDGYGSILVNCTGEDVKSTPDMENAAANDIVFLKGVVASRAPDQFNHRLQNGKIEIKATELKLVKDPMPEESSESLDLEDMLVKVPIKSKYREYEPEKDAKKRDEKIKTVTASPDFNRYTLRSHTCGEIDESHVGQTVHLMGWALFVRMNRFILLKDKYGTVQLVVPDTKKKISSLLADLPLDSVVSVKGTVFFRPEGQKNEHMKSGAVEVYVEDLEVINKASVLTSSLRNDKVSKKMLMKHRYLDIRNNWFLQQALKLRCDALHKVRRFLIEQVGFLEVETPTLFRRTPGGAQEFIVPTRTKGEFYSLVQSPQQFKQLLMVGAIDRYFQIARCYRDEPSRTDRQPEFTQLDIEMSFCDRDGVINLVEDLIKLIWPKNLPRLKTPFPRMTYDEAMTTYGSDKPDTRFHWKIMDLTDVFEFYDRMPNHHIDMNKYMALKDFAAHALIITKGDAVYSFIHEVTNDQKWEREIPIFDFKFVDFQSLEVALSRLFSQSECKNIMDRINVSPDDVFILGLGPKMKVLKALGEIRLLVRKHLHEHQISVIDGDIFHFSWILDFPLFDAENGVIKSTHHPFTSPHPDDVNLLHSEPLKVRSLHYDLVLNGSEIGGGSIRIHNSEFQKEILENVLNLDISPLDHLIEALNSGAPVHGGFALGIDRLIANLCGVTAISDVMAFPKFSSGRDPLSGAPSAISDEEKALYHIQ